MTQYINSTDNKTKNRRDQDATSSEHDTSTNSNSGHLVTESQSHQELSGFEEPAKEGSMDESYLL